MKIHFQDSQVLFRPAKRPNDEEWIDTSFAKSSRAVGRLRLPSVDNGRYASKHPILDANGTTVGFLSDGQGSIGYTFACVYAGGCFWIAHQGFGATMHGGGSNVSIVDGTGTFLFSSNAKFGVVNSFAFGRSWVDSIRVFKLLDDEAYLLYLTNYGVCLFDTRRREIVAKADFADLAYQCSGFAISPKVKLLALGFSARGEKDPLDGEYRYSNFVRIYNLETGDVVGQQNLMGDRETRWTVEFSEDGRQMAVQAGSSAHLFELNASK